MKKINKALLFFGVIGFACACIVHAENPFVVKKKKLPSTTTLKENNVQLLGDLLQELPALIRSVTKLQEVSMQRLISYVEGQKKCFWACATKSELDACCTKLQQFEQRAQWMQKQIQEITQFLKELEK